MGKLIADMLANTDSAATEIKFNDIDIEKGLNDSIKETDF